MKTRSITLTVVAIAALLIAGIAIAAPHGMGHRGGAFGPLGHLEHLAKAKEALGLSDQQVDQIKAIFKDLREQNATYRDQMHDGMKSAFDTLVQDPSNVAGAQAQLDRQAAAEAAMKTNALNAASKALSVLTPEQRTKLAQFVEQRHAAWGHRSER